MVRSVLIVCVGNICRSPLGERALRQLCPELTLASAGLAAVVGAPADAEASAAATEAGISLEGHRARQFTAELGAAHDLILVMEPGHRREILRRFPHLAGRTLLFDQWSGAQGIADPYQRPAELHRQTCQRILLAAKAWASRLGKVA